MKVKNYRLESINGDHEYLTSDETAIITKSWADGAKFIIVNGNIYATHQIKSIRRLSRQDEENLYYKLELLEKPRFEQLMEVKFKQKYDDKKNELLNLYSIETALKSTKKFLQ